MYEWHFDMGRRNALILCVTGALVFASMVYAQDPHGTPGVDYPNYFTIPETSFKCSGQKYNPGFYADVETKCQAFHFCYQDRQESFLCPTGTIFNQAVLTCDVWHKSNCSLAQKFYSVNAGPVMERAGKNLPMLLRLRNRSQSKSTVTSSANVLNKVSSLYENKPSETETVAKTEESDTKTSDLSIDNSFKESDNKNEESILDNQEHFESEENIETDKNEFINEVDEEMDANMVYDTVNDGYYENYNQYDEYQDTEPENQEFNDFYGYRNTDNEYERDELEGYVNEESFDSEYPDFTKRSSQTDRSRVRRKPLYVVLNEETEAKSEEMTEKSDIESEYINSELSDSKEMNLTSESADEAIHGPETSAIPHHLLNISTHTPMASEEFEQAIYNELVVPGMATENYEEEIDASYPQEDKGSSQPEQTYNQYSDTESDDDIYIENDIEPNSYAPYDSQYEDVIVVPEPGEEAYVESYSESPGVAEAEVDTEDTFVVIPDEYDNNEVDSVSSEDGFEISDYSDETAYGTQVLADQPPETGYGAYDNSYRYSPSADYQQYYEQESYYPEQTEEMYGNYEQDQGYGYDEQERNYPEQTEEMYDNYEQQDQGYGYDEQERNYPEQTVEMYDNYAQQDQGYDYDNYNEQSQPIDYENSDFYNEEAYTQTELNPYEETQVDVTERPIPLPVTEADFDNLSNENFNEILEEQDIIEESEQPEDLYYVLDEEQPNELNETEVSEGDDKTELEEESLVETVDQVAEQNPEVKPMNNSNEESSLKEESLDSQTHEELSNSDEQDWSNLLSTSQNEETKPANVKPATNQVNTVASPNLKYTSQPTLPVHESLASFNTPFSSNMGSFDFSTDSRFLNNMGYSESMDFGPYGFGPNMGQQFSMMESMQSQGANPFSQRISPVEQPKLSPLSAIQEKMRSMKQGKFGAFKKYMSSTSK